MRQIAGAFAEYEKARLVSKLRHARECRLQLRNGLSAASTTLQLKSANLPSSDVGSAIG